MDDSVEIHAPEEVLQLPSKRASSDGSSKSKQAKTATSSGSKATEVEKSAVRPSRSREPKKSMASSVSVVGRPSSDGLERHRSQSGDRKRRSHGSDRGQDSPRHHASRHDSGRREGEWSRPSSSGGSSSRRQAQADSTDGSESSRVSKATDARPSASSSHAHHQVLGWSQIPVSIVIKGVGRPQVSAWSSSWEKTRECWKVWFIIRLQTGSTAVSGRYPVSREENHNSDPFAGLTRSRGRTCSWSQRPSNSDRSVRGCGRASRCGPASDGPAGDDPADDGPAYDESAGDGSARHDEPVVLDGPEEVADLASQQSATDGPALQFDDPAGLDGPARPQPLALDIPAAHGTPAGNTPSAGQDASI